MKYQAVLFDMDDTLLKSVDIKWAHHKAVTREFYGFELTDAELEAHWGKPFDVMIAAFYRNSDTLENMHAAERALAHRYQKGVFEDALEAVNRLLEAKIEVGIITSAPTRFAIDDLSRHGFPVERFFIIQGADSSPAHKPDPDVFNPALEILSEHGVERSAIVYVGDALIDYVAARDASLDFLGVTTGRVTTDEFRSAGIDTVFASVSAATTHILETPLGQESR